MTLDTVLARVRASDIRLEAAGDKLIVDAPVGRLTPELRDALVAHKAAILARLAPVDLVSLNGGLVVPRPALELILDLESRGFRLSLDAGEQFQIEPTRTSGPLTTEDRTAIARWRLHLGALVGYTAPTPEWVQ